MRPTPSVDQWFSIAYEELRRVAADVGKREVHATLSPTALVHEAYVRLAGMHGIALDSRAHFMAIAARAMRRVLVDVARRRLAAKRGSAPDFVTLDPHAGASNERTPEDILALDGALTALAERDPRAANIVQCRFFGGLSTAETAQALGVSEATVFREWRFARAWLAQALGQSAT
jgi:RNA polymerase sigma factor (TIGR02999 family)